VTPSVRLRRTTLALGAVNVAVFAWLAGASYGLAPHSPLGVFQPREAELFRRLGASLGRVLPGGDAWLHGFLAGEAFADRRVRILAYAVPLLISAACFVVLCRAFRRCGEGIDEALVERVFRFGIAFALLSVLAYPMFASDLWLYLGWGRMMAVGLNPYYADPALAPLAGLPIEELGSRFTYGPVWAMVSGAVAAVARGSVFWSFAFMKALLAGSWLVSLWLLKRITVEDPPRDRAIAVAVFGWVPLSAHMAIGEGHNEMAMVLPLIAWLYWLRKGSHILGPSALAVSVLVKYVTLPLAALEVLAAWVRRIPLRRYQVALAGAGVVVVACFLPFYRDPGMFRALLRMQGSRFWTPGEAVADALARLGWALDSRIVSAAVGFAGVVLVIHYARRYVRDNRFYTLAAAALAVMATVLFAGVGHIWPWFVVWVVPLGALAWRTPAARLCVAMALLTPAMNVWWIRSGDWYTRENSGVVFYAALALAVLSTLAWWPGKWETGSAVPIGGEGGRAV